MGLGCPVEVWGLDQAGWRLELTRRLALSRHVEVWELHYVRCVIVRLQQDALLLRLEVRLLRILLLLVG